MYRSATFLRVLIGLAAVFAVATVGLSSSPAAATSYPALPAGSCGPMTFDPPTNYPVGTLPQIPIAGDLDGDGDDDLVVPNFDSKNLTIFLSTGAGLVAAPGSPLALSDWAWFARIGDFTGDSLADVAVFVSSGATSQVVVIQGNGDGTFGAQIVTDVSSTLTTPTGVRTAGGSFAVADLDGDLDLDFALVATNASKAGVWLGNGNGTFSAAQEWVVASTPAAVAIGDMNGDGRPDFGVGHSFADASATGSLLSVFVQQTDGTFAAPVTYEAYKSVRSLALADLNGDTNLDLIAPDYYGHGYTAFNGDDLGRVSILFGNGDGTFGNAIHPLTGADNPDSVSVADFDGDGNLDIATSNNFQRSGSGAQISILLGNGAGGFVGPVLFSNSVGAHPGGLASGDFDGNLMPDLAWFENYQNWNTPMKVMMNATFCDRTPPVITPMVTGTLGANGWYTSDAEVEWFVTDDESSITSSTGCVTTIVNGDISGFLLTCEATSGGGTSSQSVFVKRDATPPTATGSAGPPANASGWRKTNVTVTFTGTDGLSGGVTCTPQTLVTAEGANQSVTGYCFDAAGNQSAPAVVSNISIDKTNPSVTINIPTNGAVFSRNQVVSVSYSCNDTLSGVASCSGTVPNNQPLDTSKKANNAKFTVTGTDVAGNTTKTTVSYTVK